MFRQESYEVAVRLAINGRRCQPDFQAIAMGAVKGVGRSSWLDMDGQYQVFTVPLVPLWSQR